MDFYSETRKKRESLYPRLSKKSEPTLNLPILSRNVIKWIEQARPTVGGLHRNFDLIPFWEQIYEDNHPNIMVVAGRQSYKTTAMTDFIGCYGTSYQNSEVLAITDTENHLSALSKQRIRIQTFLQNPVLKQFLPHGQFANIGEITLLNGSVIYPMTDEGQYGKAEGKSAVLLCLDETQYHDLQFLWKALYTLTQTRGRLMMFGIGGEAGSEYHRLWKQTDQREWEYFDPDWREKLVFDYNGNITNSPEELRSILAGKWVAQEPQNTEYRGYHIPQRIVPTIPLLIYDALTKYKTRASISVEWQEKRSPKTIYLSHCEALFYKAERRPVTPEMVQTCIIPYLSLLPPFEVKELKAIYGNQIRVLLGIDWGSGRTGMSSTVIAIFIKWRQSNRYQLVHIERRPADEHESDQCAHIASLGHSYGIDYGVGDLGYGQVQVRLVRDGGYDSRGNRFEGLSRRRFSGCRTIGDETKPQMEYKTETDEHGEQLGRIQIDKTNSIQLFIDRLGQYVNYIPIGQSRAFPEFAKPVIMLPSDDLGKINEVDIMKDFTGITRKDIEKTVDAEAEDPRQKAKKEFNHPPDSVMACIYCFVADMNYDEGAYAVFGTKKRR